ncbi:MAG: glycoside hydrolase family 13 protein, partial [Myxococcales bacterium]|nr:glycoside hydrolase family 13 protein [Myxococcales bacterium]
MLLAGLCALAWPTVSPGAPCAIDWDAVRHDAFDPADRLPTGPVAAGGTIRLALTAPPAATRVRVRVWDAVANSERFVEMAPTAGRFAAEFAVGDAPTLLYYFFEVTAGGSGCTPTVGYYVDDDPRFAGGGTGVATHRFDALRSYQITVPAADFDTPAWLRDAVIYHVFLDRFRDGDPSNDAVEPRFHYGNEAATLWRSGGEAWNTRICDPAETRMPACRGVYSSNFYGGDLRGLLDVIGAGYFEALGVSVLYLSPVFQAPSNHKYDATDFEAIDPDFGDEALLTEVIAAARAHGMEVMLDGVFNHVSSDSVYFDRYGRYDAVGACESPDSPYRDWFYLPATENIGGRCDGVPYEGWFGFGALPKLRSDNAGVRALFFGDADAVATRWTRLGVAGWRLDAAQDVDPGRSVDPAADFWESLRAALRDPARGGRPDAALLGEHWDDASGWFLGDEWDSVMNYRFRAAALGWFAHDCAGDGCAEGRVFRTGDETEGSPLGPLAPLLPSAFDGRLRSLVQDTPAPALHALMNLAGSHDTQRVGFLLRKTNGDDPTRARRALVSLWTLMFTWPGAPTFYYGDEVGLSEDGVFRDGVWQDDPYNRAPFPWPDTPGHYRADEGLLAEARRHTSLWWGHAALRDG